MSDTSQGEGWWIASDGKWYPPELHADIGHRRAYEAPTQPEPASPEPTPEGLTKPEPAAPEPTPEGLTKPEPAAPEPTPEGLTKPEPAAPEPALTDLPPIPPPAPIDEPTPTVPPVPPPIGDPPSSTPPMPPAAPLPLGASSDPTKVFPQTPPQTPPAMPAPLPPSTGSGEASSSRPWVWVVMGVLVVAGVAAAVFALTGGGDDEASVTVEQDGTTDDQTETDSGPTSDADDTAESDSDGTDSDGQEAGTDDNSTDSGTDNSTEDGTDSDSDGSTESDSDGSDGFDPGGVGTLENPAGFGETYVWDSWHASVIDAVDPAQAGLLDEFAEPPAEGNVFVAAIYDVTFTGTDLASYLPLAITASGARVYDTFGCLLNERALAQQGIDQYTFEALAGQTVRQAECFEVPESDVDSLIFGIQNYEELFGDNEAIFARGGAALPEPPPVVAAPDFTSLDILPLGETTMWAEWSGSVLEVRDAEAEGLVSPFADASRDGFTYTAVLYEVTYTGSSASEYLSLTLAALGSRVYEGFSSCILDTEVAAAEGIETVFEMAPGQTARLAQCFEIADDDVSSLVFRLTNATDFDSEPAYYGEAN